MPFYVPLGPRGLIFQFGSLATGLMGGYVYWLAARKRFKAAKPVPLPVRDDRERPRGR